MAVSPSNSDHLIWIRVYFQVTRNLAYKYFNELMLDQSLPHIGAIFDLPHCRERYIFNAQLFMQAAVCTVILSPHIG